jgi:hypothetical protein
MRLIYHVDFDLRKIKTELVKNQSDEIAKLAEELSGNEYLKHIIKNKIKV